MSQVTFRFLALVVGVGHYENAEFADLPVTVTDALALDAILKDPNLCGFPPENVITLTGDNATLSNLRESLKWLERQSSPVSTVTIYFSGHGAREFAQNGWHSFLCPRDANVRSLAQTALSGEEFSAALSAIEAQRLVVILDACYAGSSAEVKESGVPPWKAGLPDSYYESLSHGTGRVVIASSKEHQVSYVRDQGDFSLFTYHLTAALRGKAAVRGDGLIHVLDIFHYVSEAVQRDNPRQMPILKAHNLDLNFPIALDCGGIKGAGSAPSPVIASLRERIIENPIAGAKALSDYLAAQPTGTARRTEVDLKRAEIQRIQRELDLFGEDGHNQAARARIVFFLLRECLQIEEGGV